MLVLPEMIFCHSIPSLDGCVCVIKFFKHLSFPLFWDAVILLVDMSTRGSLGATTLSLKTRLHPWKKTGKLHTHIMYNIIDIWYTYEKTYISIIWCYIGSIFLLLSHVNRMNLCMHFFGGKTEHKIYAKFVIHLKLTTCKVCKISDVFRNHLDCFEKRPEIPCYSGMRPVESEGLYTQYCSFSRLIESNS